MFEELKDLKVGDKVVFSIVPEKEASVGEVINLSKKVIVVKDPSCHPWWREFSRDSGANINGEKYGGILKEYELAIKEVGMECPYPKCGVSQRNFFMAGEFLQGGKNCNCFYCGKLLWLNLDGRTKKVTVD